MQPVSKTQQMLAHLKAGEKKEALRIAKTFRIGFTKEQMRIVSRGHEAMLRPSNYIQMKQDPEAFVKEAIDLLTSMYADKL